MAKVKISDLDAAAALGGAELVELEQDGGSVQCTTQDIADLVLGGETEITGTITGLDTALVDIFPIQDTAPYFVTAKVVLKCTDAGAGTVVVGDSYFASYAAIFISNETAFEWDDYVAGEGSMSAADTGPVQSIASGQLQLEITPPSDTGAADSEYSYKIRVSGFSL